MPVKEYDSEERCEDVEHAQHDVPWEVTPPVEPPVAGRTRTRWVWWVWNRPARRSEERG